MRDCSVANNQYHGPWDIVEKASVAEASLQIQVVSFFSLCGANSVSDIRAS